MKKIWWIVVVALLTGCANAKEKLSSILNDNEQETTPLLEKSTTIPMEPSPDNSKIEVLPIEPNMKPICDYFEGIAGIAEKNDGDCDKMAEKIDKFITKELPEFEKAFDNVPDLFETPEGTAKYQQCAVKIFNQDSPFQKCVMSRNVNITNVLVKLMDKPMTIQREKLMRETQQAMADGTYDPKIFEKNIETDQRYEPHLTNISNWFERLSKVVEPYAGKCDEMAAAENKFFDEHLDELNHELNQIIPMFEEAEGLTQFGKCIEKLYYYGSPYWNCMETGNPNMAKAHINRMLARYSEILDETAIRRTATSGDAAIMVAEKALIEGFKSIAEVKDETCEEIGEKHINLWMDAVEEQAKYLGTLDLHHKLNPGSEADIERRQLIEDAFGKNAAVHRCMYHPGVRDAYERLTRALKLEGMYTK